jgi:hypothetical protein
MTIAIWHSSDICFGPPLPDCFTPTLNLPSDKRLTKNLRPSQDRLVRTTAPTVQLAPNRLQFATTDLGAYSIFSPTAIGDDLCRAMRVARSDEFHPFPVA